MINYNWKKEKNSSYLISLLHEVYQTSFIVMAGIQTVQEARVNVLSIEMGIAGQIDVPFAFAHSRKLVLGSMLL